MTAPRLVAEALSFSYGKDRRVLDAVDFATEAGKVICVLGPNGSGKTTLLRCLLGRLRPLEGRVLLDGRPVHEAHARDLARVLAYVPQLPASAFPFTVQELVLMGRHAHVGVLGLPGQQDLAVARAAMDMTGSLPHAERTLDELSGGEAQCAMIARALAQQPAVMLLDEPTSHLDLRNQLVVYQLMRRVAHEWPMAVVCISHDIHLAARFADRLILMRQGQVLATGTPTEVIRADLLREAYDVEVELVPAGDGVPLVRVVSVT